MKIKYEPRHKPSPRLTFAELQEGRLYETTQGYRAVKVGHQLIQFSNKVQIFRMEPGGPRNYTELPDGASVTLEQWRFIRDESEPEEGE